MPTTYESRLIAAPRAEVWAAITNLEAAARWNEAWHRVEYLSGQREGVGTTFRAYDEDGVGHNFQISEWAPQEYVTFKPLEEGPEEQRYLITLESHSFLLEPAGDDHTRVELTASASARSIWQWLRVRFSPPGHQKHILRRTLGALQAPFEWLLLRFFLWPGHQRQGLGRALDALQALFEPPDGPEESGETSPQD